MSWVAASLLVLGLALVAGFAWYERTHPTSRVLALVATLAALAALGRIAFAPLPNVKPTTDIVLLTGYALGGAPGFAVGAVAALASNVFFGQGPWTPWQMCAWGAIGVGGALLARVAGRELGRAALAVACALAGAFFGAVMNLSLWVTFSGDHSLAKLGAYFVTSLPFDLAHVVGNVAFCLVFGPALVRALSRYRQRFEVSWRPAPALAAAVLAAVVLAGAAPPRGRGGHPARLAPERPRTPTAASAPTPGSARPASTAAGPGSGSPPPAATRATLKHDLVAYVRAHPRDVSDLGEIDRTILLLRAAGVKPKLGNRDLVKELLAKRRAQRLVRQPREHDLVRDLRPPRGGPRRRRRARRAPAGSRARRTPTAASTSRSRAPPPGSTTPAPRCRRSSPPGRKRTPTVRRAARFLARRQNPDGGYPLQPGGPSNAQSTAWAVQALVAAGRNPDRQKRNGARSPIAYLRSLITPSGKVRYSRTSAQTPVWVTAQALAALARKPFPLAPVPRARKAAPPAPRRHAGPHRGPEGARQAAPEGPEGGPLRGAERSRDRSSSARPHPQI